MEPGIIVARRGHRWIVLSWVGPVVVFALALGLVIVSVDRGSTVAAALSAPLAAFGAFLVSEATETVELHSDEIVVRRPPLKSYRMSADEITAIEKFTPAQWFVRSRDRSRPLTITFTWLQNAAEVQAGLEQFASRHDMSIVETDMLKDTGG